MYRLEHHPDDNSLEYGPNDNILLSGGLNGMPDRASQRFAKAKWEPIASLTATNQSGAVMHELRDTLETLRFHLQAIQSDNEQLLDARAIRNTIRESVQKALQETAESRRLVEQLAGGGNPAGPPEAVSSDPQHLHGVIASSDCAADLPVAQARRAKDLLTAREREVLTLINAGWSNKEGAHRLQISIRTFEAHRAQIMRKLGARNAVDLVRISCIGPG
jgi:DNA-binding NarL/FixJ family response regulator